MIFWQLPPVRDKALYQTETSAILSRVIPPQPVLSQCGTNNHETEIRESALGNAASDTRFGMDDSRGIQLYQSFDQSIELTVQQRQDASQVAFATALEGLRSSSVTREHWETLTTRCQVRILSQRAGAHRDGNTF